MTAVQLPLEPTAMLPLRQAYEQVGYAKHGITFQQALAAKHLAIPLRNVAEGIARNSTRSDA